MSDSPYLVFQDELSTGVDYRVPRANMITRVGAHVVHPLFKSHHGEDHRGVEIIRLALVHLRGVGRDTHIDTDTLLRLMGQKNLRPASLEELLVFISLLRPFKKGHISTIRALGSVWKDADGAIVSPYLHDYVDVRTVSLGWHYYFWKDYNTFLTVRC